MGIFANLLLKNHAGAEQTFLPRMLNPKGWYQWMHDLGGAPIGNPYVNGRSQLPSRPDGKAVHEYWLVRPHVDAPASAPGLYAPTPRVTFSNKVQIRFEVSGQATLAERQELLANAKDLIADLMVQEAVVDMNLVRG